MYSTYIRKTQRNEKREIINIGAAITRNTQCVRHLNFFVFVEAILELQLTAKQLFTGHLHGVCANTSNIVLIKIMRSGPGVEIRIVFLICHLQSLYEIKLGKKLVLS